MSSLRRARRLAGFLAGPLFACGAPQRPTLPAEPTPSSSSGPAPATIEGDAAIPERDTVELLSAGDEPKRAMRYVFHPGLIERIRTETRMTIGIGIGGRPPIPVTLPDITTKTVIEPQRATSDGGTVLRFVIESVDVANTEQFPLLRQNLARDLQRIVGFAGEISATTRGQITDETIRTQPTGDERIIVDLPTTRSNFSVRDLTRLTLRHLTATFPEEPIGRGARWAVTHVDRSGGGETTATATYTLSDSDGDEHVLDVVVTGGALPQRFRDRDGRQTTLEWVSAKGAGTMRLDLRRLAPTSDLDLDDDSAVIVDAGRAKPPTHARTSLHVHTHIQPD
jgi:hypothetical protein